SRGRGLKPAVVRECVRRVHVAPSRGRGLKQTQDLHQGVERKGRPFAGAWIETPPKTRYHGRQRGRPFAGAWIETRTPARERSRRPGRPFAGAWIETFCWLGIGHPRQVSPLRGGVD